jgi:hypothetical protein
MCMKVMIICSMVLFVWSLSASLSWSCMLGGENHLYSNCMYMREVFFGSVFDGGTLYWWHIPKRRDLTPNGL